MIIYLTISCITLCFCVITYLWVRRKRKIKKAKGIKEKWVEIMTERSIRHRRSVWGAYPNRDYFIPLREKTDKLSPKKDIKSHKLVERKHTMRRPGVYTIEVDYSTMDFGTPRRNRE